MMQPHRTVFLAGLALLSALPALAADLPTRKSGLWDLKMTFEGGNLPTRSLQQCTDPATDRQMISNFGGLANENCSKRDIQAAGDTITIDSICKLGPVTSTSHAVITGDFNKAYTVKVMSKREGGPAALQSQLGGDSNIRIEATWLGACKADQKPGDMIMGGMKINVKNLKVPGLTR